MKILVVEDDYSSRRLLHRNLEEMGYAVDLAEDGDEAWKMHDHSPYRIIVSDWLMPGTDGLELCERVRQRPDTDYAYFILLTAHVSDVNNYYEAMERGVDDFLSKPLDRQVLAIRLRVAERILRDTSRIQSLENIVTICAYTKKVKLPDDDWQTIEEFIDQHLGLKLSHGIHPDYYDNVIMPELERIKASNHSASNKTSRG